MNFGITNANGAWFHEDACPSPCAWTRSTAAQAVADHLRKMKTMLGGVSFADATVTHLSAPGRPSWTERL